MASDKENWQLFIRQNPKTKIQIEEKYILENREVVSSKYLQQIWGVTDKTIRNYISQGMPYLIEQSSSRFKIFDLIECITWRMETINMSKSNVSKVQQRESEKETTESEVFEANRKKIIADANKAEFDAKSAEIKYKNLSGELISIDDVDKAMAEQAVLHKTDLLNAEKVLPIILENKDKTEIANILRDNTQQRLDDLDKLIKREFKCEETLYEVIDEVINQLHHKEPVEIINKIKS
jgi:phage terminase Nu1 subunit (DNA packaging protein)